MSIHVAAVKNKYKTPGAPVFPVLTRAYHITQSPYHMFFMVVCLLTALMS